jgi:hypothetical protein
LQLATAVSALIVPLVPLLQSHSTDRDRLLRTTATYYVGGLYALPIVYIALSSSEPKQQARAVQGIKPACRLLDQRDPGRSLTAATSNQKVENEEAEVAALRSDHNSFYLDQLFY